MMRNPFLLLFSNSVPPNLENLNMVICTGGEGASNSMGNEQHYYNCLHSHIHEQDFSVSLLRDAFSRIKTSFS